ncbi:hypothetical protein KC909_01025 [Candidatus Dojkabacteria bacterium]|uniref:Prepilin-type N-terminal cleavage/methylation domain-containing protein n=1 Tax=Candidatus Dojkabacteria bacterium TaxID=2099670 RepID=A0A955L4K0_9BACT|nr:hypothetical protein [Candidatus Dojkabacteria bacterium]
MKNINKKIKGFSLVELVVAMTFFFMVSASVIVFSIDSLRASKNNRTELKSNLYLQEAFNAILVTKNENWIDLVNNTNSGDKHMELINNKYQIVDGTETRDEITIGFVIGDVYRDVNGDIVTSGGTYDALTREIMLTANWEDLLGQPQSVSFVSYVNSWKVERWLMSTDVEFDTGTYDTTLSATDIDDGEVVLERVFFPDWCNPELTLSEYDIINQAHAKTIFATLGYAFLGTGGNSSGTTLTKISVTGVNPPSIFEEGIFDGEKVNDIFALDGDVAYMASDNNAMEVIILDTSAEPFSIIGWFDAEGSVNAESVFVKDGIGYVGQGRRLRTFDLSSNYGSRPELGEVILGWSGAEITKIFVDENNYAYSVMANDWFELSIVDASDPTTMSITSQTSVNDQAVYDMIISEDTSRAYFGTSASTYEDEFFIVDTSSKVGIRPVVSSYNTDNNVTGVAVIEQDNRAIITASDEEEYKVLDISDEANPTYCGGTQIYKGISDLDSIADQFGNVFSYIMTGDSEAELKIILGGPGGGGEDGYAYSNTGSYESPVFDSESVFTKYLYLTWHETGTAATELNIQVRTGNSADLSGETYVGPDGTSATYFTEPNGAVMPDILNNKQYVQFKADFDTTDNEFSPVLEDISIIYQN